MTQKSSELSSILEDSLFQLKKIIDSNSGENTNLLSTVTTFLLSIISTTVDLLEIEFPGCAPSMYADVEAGAKAGGLHAITTTQEKSSSVPYSVSMIDSDDKSTAMNYLGQQLSITLFKGLHELPLPLRQPEIMLRSIEALLTNLLSQKFDSSHDILDSLCEHVHMALNDLDKRKH